MGLNQPDPEAPALQDQRMTNLLRWCAGVGAVMTVPCIFAILGLLVNLRDSNRDIKLQLTYLMANDKQQDADYENLTRSVNAISERLRVVEVRQQANFLSRISSRP
jgi:cell division protein FtsL